MTKQVNSVDVKPGPLSSIPGAYMVERANYSMLYKLSYDFHIDAMTHSCSYSTEADVSKQI